MKTFFCCLILLVQVSVMSYWWVPVSVKLLVSFTKNQTNSPSLLPPKIPACARFAAQKIRKYLCGVERGFGWRDRVNPALVYSPRWWKHSSFPSNVRCIRSKHSSSMVSSFHVEVQQRHQLCVCSHIYTFCWLKASERGDVFINIKDINHQQVNTFFLLINVIMKN